MQKLKPKDFENIHEKILNKLTLVFDNSFEENFVGQRMELRDLYNCLINMISSFVMSSYATMIMKTLPPGQDIKTVINTIDKEFKEMYENKFKTMFDDEMLKKLSLVSEEFQKRHTYF